VIKRAILSVWEKTGIVELARDLHGRGVEILSTGGTLGTLREAGIEAVSVSDFTGHPEIFAGRVKTLHPKLEGGILFRRADQALEAAGLGIPAIDLVVVNLYPFEAVTADPSCDLARAMEHVDIGGPTMIRAAAKNHADVTVIVEPAQYGALRAELDAHGGAVSPDARARFARQAFARVSAYDAAIAHWLARETFPERVVVPMSKVQDLRYGENPHQRAAFYGEAGWTGPTLARAQQLQGKELSYNNLNDGDAALQIALEFDEPVAVIVKHANPSGVAVGGDLLAAYDGAMACDPVSAFGGILAVNREVDASLVERIGKHFFEVIVAPAVTAEARAMLAAKANLRVLVVPDWGVPLAGRSHLRRVLGGYLLSDWDEGGPEERRVVTKRAPTERERADLEFAWRVGKHVKSNTIVLALDGRTVGIGAGQMSRVDASHIAARKARGFELPTVGAAVASDAFFPFPDGLLAAIESGATAVIQPGGSVRDGDVIAAADERGIAMIFTGTRHFRH
jgi:phosphoribosylaminoimidazolecarboxamide formyltransferase/IMP cyclohydrolase